MLSTPYLSDLLAQPQALLRTLENLRPDQNFSAHAKALQAGQYDGVVLTGMGASYGALIPLHLELTQAGIRSWLVESSELIGAQSSLIRKDRLVIALSQSGASGEIVELLGLCRQVCPLVGISNHKDSRLARESDSCLLTQAGTEHTVSCKTYIASLAAASMAAEWLINGAGEQQRRCELMQAGVRMQEYLDKLESHCQELSHLLAPHRPLYYLGRSYSAASSFTGALITKEACRCPAEAMSLASFRHGPMELCGPAMQAFVFEGTGQDSPRAKAYAEELRAAGMPTLLCGPDGDTEALRLPLLKKQYMPMLEILPVQAVTLALAGLKNIEAGVFKHARKITTQI